MVTNRVYMNIEDRQKQKVNIVQIIARDSVETWGEKQQKNSPNAWQTLSNAMNNRNHSRMWATKRKNINQILVNI